MPLFSPPIIQTPGATYTVTNATPTHSLNVSTVNATTLANFVAAMVVDLQGTSPKIFS